MNSLENAVAEIEAGRPATARKLLADLVQGDDPRAWFLLADLLDRGEGGPPDPSGAALYYRVAAEAGHTQAQLAFAHRALTGQGTREDIATALHWFERAAAAGEPEGAHQLGLLYARGEQVPLDLNEAARWWECAARYGHGPSMLYLGHLFGEPPLTHERAVKAVGHFLDAVENDEPEALLRATLLETRLEEALAHSTPNARHETGRYLRLVKGDVAAATREFLNSGKGNHPGSIRELGAMRERGEGVPVDLERAVKLYDRAAELGDYKAQLALARCYERGLGVPRDEACAQMWKTRALGQL